MNSQQKQFLTIGAANSRRVQFWEKALAQKEIVPNLLNYQQVINGAFSKITVPTTLRITSTGENFDLWKSLLTLGGCPYSAELSFEKGRIYPNPYWYQGWCKILQNITYFININPYLKPINTPASIQLAFHKLKCQQLLNKQGIRTPKIILPTVLSYDKLIEKLQKEKIHQVFIKPYHGSSASGVMAFRQTNGKQILYTTIQLKDGKLYNHLHLQKYNSLADIKAIIAAMIPSGLMVEEWIRKKTFQEKSVDFRILVINGKADFVVPRMSKHFITNLHLGNEKGNIEAVEKIWGTPVIENAKKLAIEAVKTIGGLFYAGVDIAISNKGIPYVLEVNAFGDMLLNIYKAGLTTYEYELQEWLNLSGTSNLTPNTYKITFAPSSIETV